MGRWLAWLTLGMMWACLPGVALAAPPEAAAPADKPLTLADYDVSHLKLGGDFTLTNQDGHPIRLSAYRGRVLVIFFGYTYCPDVCPVTMVKMGQLKRALGKQGPRMQPVFVSIDPARDTPARLKSYLSNFDGGAIALTGTPAEVQKAADLYRVRFNKEESTAPAEYLMSHTAYLYLVDGRGKLRYLFPPDVEDGLLADAVRTLLKG